MPECRTIAYVEIEAFAVQNLVDKIEAQQLDAAPVHTNIKTFPFRQFRGCVDILSGGFPCQPFSQAGKKKGVEDERHLWPFIERGIEQCRPSVVFFENVQGIISTKTGNGDSVLKYVLTSLEQLGYRATAGVFSAEEIGAPHQRKRVFILGATKAMADSNNNRYGQNTTRQEKKGGVSQEHRQEVCGGMSDRTSQQHNSELADSTDIRCGGRSNRNGAIGSGIQIEETQVRSMVRSQASGCSGDFGELADTNIEGLERYQCNSATEQNKPISPDTWSKNSIRWPSRPNEPQYDWEEPRVFETQPELGGAIDGFASGLDANRNRTDRLRLCGNGVVPGVAEKAFRVLSERLV